MGPLVKFAGAGATVPLTGFGHALCQGVLFSVQESGLIGAFTGGLAATAGGISAAVVFGALVPSASSPAPSESALLPARKQTEKPAQKPGCADADHLHSHAFTSMPG